MISLIICSRSKEISQTLWHNVEATVGIDHEWVIVDNSTRQYNIFQAYNEGVRRATGDILCFMHDDILYHTDGWGKIVEHAFEENPNTALLGLAGAHVVPDADNPMWGFQHISTVRIWTKEPLKETPFDQHGGLPDGGYWSGNLSFAQGRTNVPVANIDGLWMCCRRECFDKIKFDEQTYDGFHCYDADISMQVLANDWDILVNTEILVEHFSDSILTPDYFRAAGQWYGKWKKSLPIVRGVELEPWMVNLMKYYTMDERRYEEALMENRRLRSTHAYMIGKAILSPLRLFRNKQRSKQTPCPPSRS